MVHFCEFGRCEALKFPYITEWENRMEKNTLENYFLHN